MVVLLGIYIMAMPVLPRVSLWLNQQFDSTNGYHYQGALASGQSDNNNLKDIPDENTLLIPGINLDEKVVEGNSLGVIGYGGVWRRPNSSTPTQGGNTVLVGHRWTYNGVSTFYNLDKVNLGDRFALYWNGKEYDYEVFETKVVPASAIEIEAQTSEPIVTLYTCTPVWTARDRLVVKARLIVL